MNFSRILSKIKGSRHKRVIVSFYMDNIPQELVDIRREALSLLVGKSTQIKTIKTSLRHPEAIDDFLGSQAFDTILILDFDCLPLTRVAVDLLLQNAEKGFLVGAAQRANHIDNGGHIYVGPFCMAFSRQLFEALGRPSFKETDRGDVGAEMTYAAQERGKKILMLWPTSVEEPKWSLSKYLMFGLGTTYSDEFWHAFTLHTQKGQDTFQAMCEKIISQKHSRGRSA